MNVNVFQQLERIGKDHIDVWISKVSKRKLISDNYEAFKHFIEYGFYRNRRDELARTYFTYAHNALDMLTRQIEPSKKVQHLYRKGENITNQFTILAKKTGKVHSTDCKFLTSACNELIPKLEKYRYNVLEYSYSFLEKHDLFGLHKELDRIKGVGQKIASLYLRDALMLYEKMPGVKKYSDKLTQEELMLVYPIDTWVRKISQRILNEEGSDIEIANKIIQVCNNNGISAINVNHGIWYLGSKSQEFLLDNLERISEFKVLH